jgi:hypothetical protein
MAAYRSGIALAMIAIRSIAAATGRALNLHAVNDRRDVAAGG